MSEAQVAQVAHDGAPPVTQDKEETGFKVRASSFLSFLISNCSIQVFAGNLAYATTDEGLKAFFAPVQSDVCVYTASRHPPFLTVSSAVFPRK